jgi:hypothetical protein
MNPDFHFVLAMDVIVCTAGVGNVLRTSVCMSPTVLEAEVLCSGLEFVMMVVLSSKLFKEHWKRKIQRRYSWSLSFYPYCNSKTLITSFKITMQDVTWLVFVKTFWTRITSVFFLYHLVCHQLNIYGMNSVDVFATVKIQRKHYRSCMTHLCTSGTTSHKSLSNDWFVLCVGDAKLSLLQEVVTHVTALRKPPYCMTISVCPWFVLIMMLRTFADIALFVLPIWI